MLSEQFDVWEEEFQRDAQARLLTRQLRKRFGELPDSIRARLHTAQTDQLENWGERLLEVSSLNEVFDTEPTIAQ